jgi:hypothetical protein
MTPSFGQKILTIVMKIEFLYCTLVSFTMNIKLIRGVQTIHPQKNKNMELWHAWTANIPYKSFIFSVEFWVLSRTQNLKVKMSIRMYWVFQYQNQSTCLLEVSGCFLGFWNRLFSNLALTTSEYSKSASAEDTAESMQEQINHDKT